MDHREISVPLHLLDLMESNPKGQIHGIYKAGLKTSLDYFGICDRLKVWKNPASKGRYIIINGNQRYGLIVDKKKHEILCEHFGLNPDDEYSEDPAVAKEYKGRLKAIQNDPENEKLLQNFHVKAMQSSIDVHVMDLDKEDAKLFAASFDRNRAKIDEAKIVNNIIDEVKSKNKNIISKMVRPEAAYLQPLARTNDLVSKVSPNIAAPYEKEPVDAPADPKKTPGKPSEFGEWGDPPKNEKVAPVQTSLIPFTVSLTRSGYQEINGKILKLSSRIFREKTIQEALDQLSAALGDRALDSDSIIVEIALLTLNRHKVAAESDPS